MPWRSFTIGPEPNERQGFSLTLKEYLLLAEEVGFSHFGELNTGALRFLPEVREMCAAGKCKRYGRCWTCPPYCGTLEEAAERAKTYPAGILVQTTGEMEDSFDYECMVDTEAKHKELFHTLVERIRRSEPDCLPMGAGTCTICAQCTCPDAPCRFPEKRISSMEAYGLFVSEVCEQSGLGYYYGKDTITYTSCVLLRPEGE